jgi:hypothetical protein
MGVELTIGLDPLKDSVNFFNVFDWMNVEGLRFKIIGSAT